MGSICFAFIGTYHVEYFAIPSVYGYPRAYYSYGGLGYKRHINLQTLEGLQTVISLKLNIFVKIKAS